MLNFLTDDAKRVAALRKLKLLDTAPQESFDRITRHCADLFHCQASLFSLIDEKRQWFLSSVGVEIKETPRDVSFCNHTIAGAMCLSVEDTLEDERFATNPFVTGEPYIRSYLGFPVRGPGGQLLGALCIFDNRPRKFSGDDRARLESLAAVAEDLVRAHNKNLVAARANKLLLQETRALKKSNQLLKQAEKVGKIGAWELSLKSRTLRFSDQMY